MHSINTYIEILQANSQQLAIVGVREDKGDKKLSYQELITLINHIGSIISSSPKGVIEIKAEFSISFIASLLALAKHHHIIHLMPAESKSSDYANYYLNLEKLELVKQKPKNRHVLLETHLEQKKGGLILYSSGTVKNPNLVFFDMNLFLERYLKKDVQFGSVIQLFTFDHISGINLLLKTLSSGGTVVLPKKRNPQEIVSLIEKYHVRHLFTSPSFLALMLLGFDDYLAKLNSLTNIYFGSEPMPEPLLRKLTVLLPAVEFFQSFGTTETGLINTINDQDNKLFLKLGKDNKHAKIKDNRLYVKSKYGMIGYLNNSITKDQDGFFPTGDIVEVNEKGFFRILGREHNVINVAGHKVVPQKIEDVMLNYSNIEYVKVYGEKNFLLGNIICAQVVIKKGEMESIKKIRQYCRQNLEEHEIPVKIKFLDDIPITSRLKSRTK